MIEIKVLIVEDDPLIAIDIEQILNNLNFRVSGTAYNPEDALLSLKNNTPDIVLLDVNLDSDKDGIDVAEIINEKYQLPFIYLTAHADKTTLERAKKTKPAGYIIKPFDERDLLAGIEIGLYNYSQLKMAQRPQLSINNINRHLKTHISEREFTVLAAIYEGKTNEQMANEQFVSINTIKTHISNLYFKLDV
ncbi:MAG: response regulator transcription factor, partial [Chitinophagaceae bacterium]